MKHMPFISSLIEAYLVIGCPLLVQRFKKFPVFTISDVDTTISIAIYHVQHILPLALRHIHPPNTFGVSGRVEFHRFSVTSVVLHKNLELYTPFLLPWNDTKKRLLWASYQPRVAFGGKRKGTCGYAVSKELLA